MYKRQEPNWEDFQGFLKGEVRYASVMKQYPTEAEELFEAAEENAKCCLLYTSNDEVRYGFINFLVPFYTGVRNSDQGFYIGKFVQEMCIRDRADVAKSVKEKEPLL